MRTFVDHATVARNTTADDPSLVVTTEQIVSASEAGLRSIRTHKLLRMTFSPLPSSPNRFSTGTRAWSKCTVAVPAACE